MWFYSILCIEIVGVSENVDYAVFLVSRPIVSNILYKHLNFAYNAFIKDFI